MGFTQATHYWQIADNYLSKKQKEIAAILGNESVAMSSNWADFIKSDPRTIIFQLALH